MNLEREILKALQDLQGHLMTTKVIHSHVKLATGASKSLTDVRLALESLERKGEVNGLDHEDYGHRWKITDAGKFRLAE